MAGDNRMTGEPHNNSETKESKTSSCRCDVVVMYVVIVVLHSDPNSRGCCFLRAGNTQGSHTKTLSSNETVVEATDHCAPLPSQQLCPSRETDGRLTPVKSQSHWDPECNFDDETRDGRQMNGRAKSHTQRPRG